MAFTDNIYNIDWDKLVTRLTPKPLKLAKMLAWLKAMVSDIADLHSRYIAYKNYTVYWLGINSQVCFMEKALNDKYDISLRRIYITDGVEFDPLPLYLKIENKPVTFFTKAENTPIVLYTKSETAQFSSDFIVWVPAGLHYNKKEMMAVIDSIKLPSKTYIIKKY